MQTKLVAIVGMCGAGKSAVSDVFVKSGFLFYRFGQVTLDEVKRRGLPPTEENERGIREGFRRDLGMGAFATLAIPRFEELLTQGNVVADGMYSWAEYKILKEKYAGRFTVVAVYAPPEMRYARLEARTRVDMQMRHRPMTREQAIARDFAELEKIEKGGPIAMADETIMNVGTVEELYEKTSGVVEKIISL